MFTKSSKEIIDAQEQKINWTSQKQIESFKVCWTTNKQTINYIDRVIENGYIKSRKKKKEWQDQYFAQTNKF